MVFQKKEKKLKKRNETNISSSIEEQLKQGQIQYDMSKEKSELITAMELLKSNENLESNTILSNEQVNGLVIMDWAGHVYDIDFFKRYSKKFPLYRISGDDGRGRKELIEIAKALQVKSEKENEKIWDLLVRK